VRQSDVGGREREQLSSHLDERAQRAAAARVRRKRRLRRRRRVFLAIVVIAAAAIAIAVYPRGATLTPLQSRIVTTAESELGYQTSPSNSYCNRFSAYWHVGQDECAAGLTSEEWCADFAAWVWRRAGVHFTYGFTPSEINNASISFYYWGVDHGTWHPVGDQYIPRAGDVAVYGLDLAEDEAQHVAIVTSYVAGARGPNVVNGDGARTAFSIVETGTDQWKADIHDDGGRLAGYVSPTRSNES
jgi:hypothetical protein